jgi:hypothetical protein
MPETNHNGSPLIIQILIAVFALYAITRTFLRYRKGNISLTETLVWSCFWIVVGLLALKPDITQKFAKILGVGRGADAVFYVSLLGLSYAFFRLYLKNRHTEQQITKLVRELALKEAEREKRD